MREAAKYATRRKIQTGATDKNQAGVTNENRSTKEASMPRSQVGQLRLNCFFASGELVFRYLMYSYMNRLNITTFQNAGLVSSVSILSVEFIPTESGQLGEVHQLFD